VRTEIGKQVNLVSVIKWTSTAVTLCGAAATALRIDPLNMYLLNIGSVLFLVWACMIKDKAMITVNFGLLSIYVFGLFYGNIV